MNPALRKAIGPLWPMLVRARTSTPVRMAKAMAGAPAYARATRGGRQVTLDLDQPVGMGGLIAHALLLHAWAEDKGSPLQVRSTSPLYAQGDEDLFAQWFVRESANAQPLGRLAAEHVIRTLAPQNIPLERAEALFARHFAPSPHLHALIDDVRADVGQFEVAIHYRGTDKVLDSGRVAEQVMLDAAAPVLAGQDGRTVFLATDDTAFVCAIRSAWPKIRFVSYDIGDVPEGQPRHFSGLSPRDKAAEALVNIFLIAEARIVVRSSSFLSAIARLANPAQHTITINRTLARESPFPEREILEHEDAGKDPSR